MSESPADLLGLRGRLAEETGLPSGDIGIVADEGHLTNGGYHCGAFDLRRIGAVTRDDYSIRQTRDRTVYSGDLAAGRNNASAMDVGDDWPRGGRAAWIRFNKLMRAQLGANDPALAAVRGMNFSPDGTLKRRFDCLTHQETSSTDTVTWHTHIEWWRDTIGGRANSINRIVQIAVAARDNTSLAPLVPTPQEAGMLYSITDGTTGSGGVGTDALGRQLVHNSRCIATPNGPVSLEYGTIIAAYTKYPELFLPITLAGLQEICTALRQPVQVTLSAEQFADFKAGAVPIVHDAAQSGALAALESPEGQALLVQAANTAEDS